MKNSRDKDKQFSIGFHDPSGSIPDEKTWQVLFQATGRELSATIKQQTNGIRYKIINGLSIGTIDLDTIHKELGKADAFVFLPHNDLDHDLKLLSMFVGVQTGDENMFITKIGKKERQKPVIVVNHGDSYKELRDLIEKTEYISREHKTNIIFPLTVPNPADNPAADAPSAERFAQEIRAAIDLALGQEKSIKPHHNNKPVTNKPVNNGTPSITKSDVDNDIAEISDREEPKFKVCVFCSASKTYYIPDASGNIIQDDEHSLAYQLGKGLANAGYGVVSGAGAINMMGDVILGARSVGGWTAGSNTPVIRKLERLPDIEAYIDMPDIYKRMKVMIEGSDAFIVAPGGAGSIQEFLTLMHYKMRDHKLMKGKPVVILNPKDAKGHGYWDALIRYAEKRGLSGMFEVAHSVEEAQRMVGEQEKLMPGPLSTPWRELVQQQKELIEQQKKDADPQLQTAI